MAAVVGAELMLVVCLQLLAGYMIRRNATRSFDTALHGQALSTAAQVRFTEGPTPELQFDNALPLSLNSKVPDLFRIETQDGRVLTSSHGLDDLRMMRGEERIWEFTWKGTTYRGLYLPNVPVMDAEENAPKSSATLNVTYAASTGDMMSSLNRAFLTILVGGLILLMLSVFVSFRAIERGLSPVTELAVSANSISTRDWDLKLQPSVFKVEEIAPLADAMSRMVQTLHAAFQQQRDFTSNAAHELKTPVAVLKSTLQSLLQQPRSGEVYRDGIGDALQDLGRLETLLHAMLRLARAEQNPGPGELAEFPNADVVGTCEAAIARLAPLAHNRETSISMAIPSEAVIVAAPPEDLEIVWANLIENAIRYGPSHSEVRVKVSCCEGVVQVAIEDGGSETLLQDMEKIFERFYRGDESRSRDSGGYGLGLAITKAFVQRYGGSISATPLEPSGLRVSVEFPSSGEKSNSSPKNLI